MKLKNNKIHIYLFFAAVIIITGYLISNHTIETAKAKRFFLQHPEKIIIWEKPQEEFIKAVKNNLLARDLKYIIYEIKPGDNYWKLAKKYNTDVDTILACNPHIKHLYAGVGDKLVIINKKGALHYIEGCENLKILSLLYNVSEEEIRKANKISLIGRLHRGEVVFIPGGKPHVFTKSMYEAYKLRKMFITPVHGWIGAHYGWRIHPFTKKRSFHKGIDLGAPYGAPIMAAASGVVTYAGWAGNYGKMIEIDHGNGFRTRYAHCSKIYVRIGQRVKQGQIIGRVGKTGRATTKHLHFEVRKNGKPINPLKVLW